MSSSVGHHALPVDGQPSTENPVPAFEPEKQAVRTPSMVGAPLASDRRSGRPDLVAAQPHEDRTLSRRREVPKGEGRRNHRDRSRTRRSREDTGLANESYKWRGVRTRLSPGQPPPATGGRWKMLSIGSGRARGVVSEARPDPPMATPLLRLRE